MNTAPKLVREKPLTTKQAIDRMYSERDTIRMAEAIKDYWQKRGRDFRYRVVPEVHAKKNGPIKMEREFVWKIVSNTLNGMPPKIGEFQ